MPLGTCTGMQLGSSKRGGPGRREVPGSEHWIVRQGDRVCECLPGTWPMCQLKWWSRHYPYEALQQQFTFS